MKYTFLLLLIFSIFSKPVKAGLYDWEYFEPALGCVGAGALGYVTASEGNEMKNAAIYCAVAGGVLLVIGSHYESKFGDEFIGQETYLTERLQSFDLLEKQSKNKVESLHFKRHQKLVPPRIDQKGQGQGPRIIEKLVEEGKNDMIGM